MTFGVHPLILIAAIGLLLALIAFGAACFARGGIARVSVIVLGLVFLFPAAYVFLAFHPELVDGRFRTYKAFYRDIQIGMSRDEVFGLLDRHYPKSGARQRPKVMEDKSERLGFFMNPETSSEPNCDGIFLTLDHGRVTKKDYSPD